MCVQLSVMIAECWSWMFSCFISTLVFHLFFFSHSDFGDHCDKEQSNDDGMHDMAKNQTMINIIVVVCTGMRIITFDWIANNNNNKLMEICIYWRLMVDGNGLLSSCHFNDKIDTRHICNRMIIMMHTQTTPTKKYESLNRIWNWLKG